MSRRAVVVGSGMGGLTAAVLLQSNGWQVTVLEQHTRPGGLLHRFFRDGVPYDTGFHYTGAIEPGQALGQCLRHLGVWDRLTFRPLDPDGFDRLLFPDDELRVPFGRDRWRERLKDRFPHEARGIDAVFRDLEAAVEPYGLYHLRPTLDIETLLHWEGQTVDEVLGRHLTDPRCKAMLTAQSVLYGVPPAEAPFGLHAIVIDHLLKGAYTLDGGGDSLARAMVARLRELGGRVLLKREVVAIDVDGRDATAVRLADGEVLPADLVVSNLHPRATLDLLPEGAVRPVYRKRVRDQRLGVGHLGVYVELDAPASCIGNANIYRQMDWDPARWYDGTKPGAISLYYACAPGEHGHASTRGRNTVLMILPLDWQQVAPWADSDPDDRPPEYRELKAALLETALDQLLQDFPDLQGHVVRATASTPLATARFVRSPEGAMYGHYHAVDQMGRYRPAQGTRVKNLVLVGQGVGFPGILGVTLSAYYAVGYLLGREQLTRELEQA